MINIWAAARADRRLAPFKNSIDPIDLGRAQLLPQVWLVHRDADRRFAYRLAGEEINAVFGRTINGLSPSEMFEPDQAVLVAARWHRLLDESLGSHTVGEVYSETGHHYVGERIALPLADENGTLCFVLGATDYQMFDNDAPGTAGLPPVRQRTYFPLASVVPLPEPEDAATR